MCDAFYDGSQPEAEVGVCHLDDWYPFAALAQVTDNSRHSQVESLG